MGNAGNESAVVIGKRRCGAARVSNGLNSIIAEVTVGGGTLLRRRARLQPPVTIEAEGPRLARLIDRGDLIASVESVGRRCVDGLVVIQLLDFDQTSEYVVRVTFATASLVATGNLIPAGTATPAMSIFTRGAVRVGREQGPAIPVISLRGRGPAGGIITARRPTRIHLRRVCLLRDPTNYVVKDQLAGISASTVRQITTRCSHATSTIVIRDAIGLAGAVLDSSVRLNVTRRTINITSVGAACLVRDPVRAPGKIISVGLHVSFRILTAGEDAKIVVVLHGGVERIRIRDCRRIGKGVAAIVAIRERILIIEECLVPQVVARESQ